MKFHSSDPDIETICRRINEGDIDLQPDFQRGEVWSVPKKKRLIDTILRGWHIPPVHLVQRNDELAEVLDGQQRLSAIRDFVAGEFDIDGTVEPENSDIRAYNRKSFDELPQAVKKRFLRYTIRLYTLTDYLPDEPHELFFRLNQPTSLNEAEKRNAFFGAARSQVRNFVDWAESNGLDKENVGFGPARMAYDDLIARCFCMLETGSISEKITAAKVTERYRKNEGFDEPLVIDLKNAFLVVLQAFRAGKVSGRDIRPNKSTIFSWVMASVRLQQNGIFDAPENIEKFALLIQDLEEKRWHPDGWEDPLERVLVSVFQDRSTARVNDVSSVMIRNSVILLLFANRIGIEAASWQSNSVLEERLWESEREFSRAVDSLYGFGSEGSLA